MTKIHAYAAASAGARLAPTTIDRRDPGPDDVVIDILFCGVCHSDIHQARGEWDGCSFPMVPGHEIVGRVARVGARVAKVAEGDLVGVGVMVDSCRDCIECREGLEHFCRPGTAFTYNSTEMDRRTPTYGGYSTHIVVAEHFVLRIPRALDPAAAAPLLCAGITTYSPLRQLGCKRGDEIAVVGLGGLGHMAVKFAAAMGASVTVLSTSPAKEEDARRLGARGFAVTSTPGATGKLASRFDLIIDSVSAAHDIDALLGMLRPRGSLVLVGIPPEAVPVSPGALVMGNRRLCGSQVGGIAETQEMLDFCAQNGIVSDVEVISMQSINEAYERMLRGDVRYRFVIDVSSLR